MSGNERESRVARPPARRPPTEPYSEFGCRTDGRTKAGEGNRGWPGRLREKVLKALLTLRHQLWRTIPISQGNGSPKGDASSLADCGKVSLHAGNRPSDVTRSLIPPLPILWYLHCARKTRLLVPITPLLRASQVTRRRRLTFALEGSSPIQLCWAPVTAPEMRDRRVSYAKWAFTRSPRRPSTKRALSSLLRGIWDIKGNVFSVVSDARWR